MTTRHIPTCTNSTAPSRRVSAPSKSRGNYAEHAMAGPLRTPLRTVKLTYNNTATVAPALLAHSQSGEISKG